MEITPTFSCPLATKWKQRLRVNVKLFQEQGKIKMISALYIDHTGDTHPEIIPDFYCPLKPSHLLEGVASILLPEVKKKLG